MIKYLKGDLLSSNAQALVNTVNTVGVMGKGIALQFKKRFPHNFKVYKKACDEGTFSIGQVLVVKDGDLMQKKIIINFPTKKHWRGNSKYEYIETGLTALKEAIRTNNIKSVAIPPLGCGHGGLEWDKVKTLIQAALNDLDCEIEVYTPNEHIKEILQRENTSREVKLTPARAMLLYLMFQYEAMGEQSSLFVANKLAWFLQRSGEKLKLKFTAHHYGPYAVQVNHVLLHLNGVYLKGMEQNVVKPFEPLQLNYNKIDEIKAYIDTQISAAQRARLDNIIQLLIGYASSFSLELLASVDYLYAQDDKKDVNEIIRKLTDWNKRKTNLFDKRHVKIAYSHLQDHASALSFR